MIGPRARGITELASASALVGLLAWSCGPGRAAPETRPASQVEVPAASRQGSGDAPLPECPRVSVAPSREADVEPEIEHAAGGCVVSGYGVTPDSPLTLHRTPRLDSPLATIDSAHPIVITDFQEGRDVARATLRGSLRVRGYAALGGIELANLDRLWIHPKRVSANPESELRVVRFRNGRLDVRIATLFDSPKWLETSAPCAKLSVGDPFAARKIEQPEAHALPDGDTIVTFVQPPTSVYDAPNGRELFSFVFSAESNYPVRLESRGGFVRIASQFGNIAVDAWVRADEVTAPARITGYSRARVPKLRMATSDVGAFAIAPTGAELLVGQPGSLEPAGSLMPNVRVRARGSNGDLVAIATLDGISAPRDMDFWVRRSQITECEVRTPKSEQ